MAVVWRKPNNKSDILAPYSADFEGLLAAGCVAHNKGIICAALQPACLSWITELQPGAYAFTERTAAAVSQCMRLRACNMCDCAAATSLCRRTAKMAAPQAVGGKVDDATPYILEECEIYFMYRPIPGKERIKDETDVAE